MYYKDIFSKFGLGNYRNFKASIFEIWEQIGNKFI